MRAAKKTGWAALAVMGAGAILSGCGMPAAPMPPSLNLPVPVRDLSASRTGDLVTLTWTMPRKNTDKMLLKNNVAVRVCRRESINAACATVGRLELAPGEAWRFTETLTGPVAEGAPRRLSYFVELENKKGRSAGLSNAATVLAGAAPAAVSGLRAEVRKDGVVLHWLPVAGTSLVQLRRTLLTPVAGKSEPGLLQAPKEQTEQNLLVDTDAQDGRAIDKSIRFGETYAYRAQRVARVTVDGKTLDLDGPLSAPVMVEARDVFPPAAPTGLAAVATAGGNGVETAIDLSWQPDGEANVAGYAVYRREGDGTWMRISPKTPVVGPGYHDAQVQPGHTYEYAVTAIGQNGHESGRSRTAEETVPEQ